LARVGRTHIIIPDCQVKPGMDISYLTSVGNYIASKRPDVVVNLGDFADMHSLSSYDVGKIEAEGARYAADVKVTHEAMQLLMAPLKKERYRGELHLTLGNHENRIVREASDHPRLEGKISVDDLEYERFGWRVHKFLKVVKLDSVEYAHYFESGDMGRAVSSAAALLRIRHSSAVMGHRQQREMAFHKQTQHIGLFAGICYPWDEKYLGPQGNVNRPGIWVLNEVGGGTFDPMFVSLGFLKKNYS
jgi:hypothetical protein